VTIASIAKRSSAGRGAGDRLVAEAIMSRRTYQTAKAIAVRGAHSAQGRTLLVLDAMPVAE
jgi:hypothetical protein